MASLLAPPNDKRRATGGGHGRCCITGATSRRSKNRISYHELEKQGNFCLGGDRTDCRSSAHRSIRSRGSVGLTAALLTKCLGRCTRRCRDGFARIQALPVLVRWQLHPVDQPRRALSVGHAGQGCFGRRPDLPAAPSLRRSSVGAPRLPWPPSAAECRAEPGRRRLCCGGGKKPAVVHRCQGRRGVPSPENVHGISGCDALVAAAEQNVSRGVDPAGSSRRARGSRAPVVVGNLTRRPLE